MEMYCVCSGAVDALNDVNLTTGWPVGTKCPECWPCAVPISLANAYRLVLLEVKLNIPTNPTGHVCDIRDEKPLGY